MGRIWLSVRVDLIAGHGEALWPRPGGHDRLGAPEPGAMGMVGYSGPISGGEAVRMALRFKLQVVLVDEDGEEAVVELAMLGKAYARAEQLGLSLAEAKSLLRELQRQVLERQGAAFLARCRACPACGQPRGLKEQQWSASARSSVS